MTPSPARAWILSWPTLFAFLGFCLLVTLGTWQLQRLAWKEGLIQELSDKQNQPPLSVQDLEKCRQNVTSCLYRKVRLEGTYAHSEEAHLYGRTYAGKPVTYVVTPLILSSGERVLVDRGWMPENVDQTSLKRDPGPVTFVGYIRDASSRNSFTPANLYEKKRLFSIEPGEWAKAFKDESLFPFYVVAQEKDSPSPFPRPGEPLKAGLRNFHLSYAITWYALAFALVVVYAFFIAKQTARRRPS